jgi:hypothetical protein
MLQATNTCIFIELKSHHLKLPCINIQFQWTWVNNLNDKFPAFKIFDL